MAEHEGRAARNAEAAEKPAEETKKKKGGKLPVILALVLLLAGGGYFVMKMKSKGGPEKVPEVKLGEIVPLKEYLINLNSASSYGRIEISLHLKEGFTKEELEKSRAAVDDAINLTVGKHGVSEVQTLEGKLGLKIEIAEAINKVLLSAEADAKKEPAAEGKSNHPDWDSQTGPVLKVYFTGFATQ